MQCAAPFQMCVATPWGLAQAWHDNKGSGSHSDAAEPKQHICGRALATRHSQKQESFCAEQSYRRVSHTPLADAQAGLMPSFTASPPHETNQKGSEGWMVALSYTVQTKQKGSEGWMVGTSSQLLHHINTTSDLMQRRVGGRDKEF